MTSVKNCQFKFKCHMTWDSLLVTSDSKIKYCPECDRGVHFCEDDQELNHALMKDWCVAIENESTHIPTSTIPVAETMTLGSPASGIGGDDDLDIPLRPKNQRKH
jgi:hypothetical protein